MRTRVDRSVDIFIALHPCVEDTSEERTGDTCCTNDMAPEEGCGSMARPNRMPCIVLPSSLQVQGSGTHILFHNGCIDHRSIATTLGDAAWEELRRSGTFWFLSCVPPHLSAKGESQALSGLGEVEAFMLQDLTGRVLDVASSPLEVSVIQWMEGGAVSHTAGEDELPWRYSNESSGQFMGVQAVVEFVKERLTDTEHEAATFCFHLVSITFLDSRCARTSEIVLAGVNASFEALPTSNSRALVAVRCLFANAASAVLGHSQPQGHGSCSIPELNAWTSQILPEEIVRFLIVRRLYSTKRVNEEEVEEEREKEPCQFCLPSVRVVYAVLEIDEKALLHRDKEVRTDHSTSAPLLRYIFFWCALGALVVTDDVDADCDTTDGRDNNAMNGTQDNTCGMDPRQGPANGVGNAKEWLQKLLIEPLLFSRLMDGWRDGGGGDEVVCSTRRLLTALEQSHHVANWVREKGLQRRVRGLVSSAVHPSISVGDVLSLYSAESDALTWCQRLEWEYYTALGDLFASRAFPSGCLVATKPKQHCDASVQCPEASNPLDKSREMEMTLLRHESYHEGPSEPPPEGITSVEPRTLASPCEELSYSTACFSPHERMLQSLLVSSGDLSRRLIEAEAVRRLLIEFRAAECMVSILFSLADQWQRCHVKQINLPSKLWLTKEDEDEEVEKAWQHALRGRHGELHLQSGLLREYTNMTEGIFLLLLDNVEEKLLCFMDAAAAPTRENKLNLLRVSPFKCMDATVRTTMLSNERQPALMCGDFPGSESYIFSQNDNFHQQLSAEVLPTMKSVDVFEDGGFHLQRRLGEEGDAPTMEGGTLSGPSPHPVEDAAKDCCEDGRAVVKDKRRVPMTERDSLVSFCLNRVCRHGDTLNEVSSGHRHRLCRANTRGSAQDPLYRRLLTTGGVKTVADPQATCKGPLPALSFSDITKESAGWSESQDLDDFRKLFAYGIYVVGAAGSGKSSLICALLREASLVAPPPTVELHTMTIRRTSTIVEVPFPKNPLPLGGHCNATPSNLQQWMNAVEEGSAAPSRVCVNLVELPGPFLLVASRGCVKLPIRGVVYCITYHLQDDWEVTKETIWQHVLTLQYAVAMPSSHVANVRRSDTDNANDARDEALHLPVVLVGTHADSIAGLPSTERLAAAQHQLNCLQRWFEERVELQKGSAENHLLPQPMLVDSCLTNTFNFLFISDYSNNRTAFQTLFHRMLRFLHHTAPLSPIHLLARWLPQRLLFPRETPVEAVSETAESTELRKSYPHLMMSGTLEGFWELQRHRGVSAAAMEKQYYEGDHEDGKAQQISLPAPISPHTLGLWWSRSSAGLLVLFTALQRLRQFVSCCFDEQSLENAVLYHLGFVSPDAPDEVDVGEAMEPFLCERDVFLEALLEECRLRGVLLFLSCTLANSLEEKGCESDLGYVHNPSPSRSLPQRLCMVILGPEWVENIWSKTLAPQMVVYHTMSLLRGSESILTDALSNIFGYCEEQLGIAFTAADFTAVWPQLSQILSTASAEAAADNINTICDYFYQYLTRGSVSLALLQFLWGPPYNILATNEMSARMALVGSGLARRKVRNEREVSTDDQDGLMQLYLPSAVLTNRSLLCAYGD
ncbi:hypothetical protein TraAM80_00774 [Trypanosoma rangeli]|uniref:Uncharacterized protein n=1 Tax=Trypanosoma rangeli TaxID=5698 RepID=A0A3R7NU14_TRYRA|nr:uncharacterized protein TraAM80_00774 [Trypanosoma rangeli]RNF11690.1 hypothetical protein TraAM80_00774 [Trypanosoma rangeli]|eukprot:RNF11690.1 hypothetical protein TraAM80_00774 [Trypanosoma rangeli]